MSRSLSTILLQMVFGLSPLVLLWSTPVLLKSCSYSLSCVLTTFFVEPRLAAYFIALCHLQHSLVCLSLLPSDLRRLDVIYKKQTSKQTKLYFETFLAFQIRDYETAKKNRNCDSHIIAKKTRFRGPLNSAKILQNP